MWTVSYIFLCSFAVVIAEFNMSLKNDRPALMVKIGDKATMECCWECQQGVNATWFARIYEGNWTTRAFERPVNATEDISIRSLERGECCGSVSFKSVKMSDTGMYRCRFSRGNQSITNSHGTYLHVYEPLKKTINLSENTKNKILTVQGILLFLCVLLPSFSILCQSKRLHELEKKKVQKEEENIYQGLNLDDCYAAYDQIERSQNNGPYQDVCNVLGDDIQLEKP